MKLGQQLTFLSLTFLVLPWAGCEFLKANERSLVQLQEQALAITVQAIADGLNNQKNLLYPAPERSAAPFSDQSLQVKPLPTALVLDGYFDDWPDQSWRQFGTDRRSFQTRLGGRDKQVLIAIKVADASKIYDQSGPSSEPTGDRLMLVTWRENRRQQYVISTPAPGEVVARPLGRQLQSARPESIRGAWVDVGDGYQLELSMPLAITGERLGIYYLDADEGGISVRGNINPLDTRAPPFLITAPSELEVWLKRYEDYGLEVQILDRWGWPLATLPPAIPHSAERNSLRVTHWLYELILDTPEITAVPETLATGQITGAAIRSSQNGLSDARIFAGKDGLRSRFTAPIRSPQGVIGVVVGDAPRDRYLSLSMPAFQALLVSGIGALALCYLVLLGFAMVLGSRIKRLSKAVSNLGEQDAALPVDRFADELSDLTETFNKQLEKQRQLQDYLRKLPQNLAHEIRTPIAIIRSAMALLGESGDASRDKTEIMARADSGVERLTRLLSNMNEANQLEQIVGRETLEPIDLVVLVDELVKAYGATFSDWCFSGHTDNASAETKVSPDLIVQAFDKLVANAVSFTQTGETITLKVERRGLWWRLTVTNPGPVLPSEPGQIFRPMVSLRDTDKKQAGTLGLGLYIVSLVARHHGGEPWARNLEHGTGVEIGFTVRANP